MNSDDSKHKVASVIYSLIYLESRYQIKWWIKLIFHRCLKLAKLLEDVNRSPAVGIIDRSKHDKDALQLKEYLKKTNTNLIQDIRLSSTTIHLKKGLLKEKYCIELSTIFLMLQLTRLHCLLIQMGEFSNRQWTWWTCNKYWNYN